MNPRPITREEGGELAALRLKAFSDLSTAEVRRYIDLRDQCLIYGSEGVVPRPFLGLEPRYARG